AARGDDRLRRQPPHAALPGPLRRAAGRGELGLPDARGRRAGARRLQLPLRQQRPVARGRRDAREAARGPLMLPYGRQSVDASDVEAVVAALSSDWLTTGPR